MAGFLIISSCCRPSRILTENNSGYGNSAIDIVRCWKGGRCVDRDETKMELPASRATHSPSSSIPLSSGLAFSLLSACIECMLRRKCSMRIIAPCEKVPVTLHMHARDPYQRRGEYQSVDFTCLPVHSSLFIVVSGAFDVRCEEPRRFVSIRVRSKERTVYKLPPLCPSFSVSFPTNTST